MGLSSPDERYMPIEGEGIINLGAWGYPMINARAKFVPSLQVSLLGTSQLPEGFSHVSDRKQAKILDPQGRVLIQAPNVKGSYKLSMIKVEEEDLIGATATYMATNKGTDLIGEKATYTATHKNTSFNQWHQRTHANDRCLKDFLMNCTGDIDPDKVTGMKEERPFCTACAQGKSHQEPVAKESTTPTQFSLEVIHADLCGPIDPPSVSGFKYVASITDKHTGYRWVAPPSCQE